MPNAKENKHSFSTGKVILMGVPRLPPRGEVPRSGQRRKATAPIPGYGRSRERVGQCAEERDIQKKATAEAFCIPSCSGSLPEEWESIRAP